MTEHTPTPWRIRQEKDCRQIVTGEPVPWRIAEIIKDPGAHEQFDDTEEIANAEFIVRACNSHKKLLTLVRSYVTTYPLSELADEAHAAIALAEKKE